MGYHSLYIKEVKLWMLKTINNDKNLQYPVIKSKERNITNTHTILFYEGMFLKWDQLRIQYEVGYQHDYQAWYQPEYTTQRAVGGLISDSAQVLMIDWCWSYMFMIVSSSI